MKNGEAWPAVWPSRDKHGSYVNKSSSCQLFGTCFDQCDDNNAPTVPPIVNAGEPGHPLTNDLTDHGFITTANGWKNMELFHFDPWKDQDFGGAGNVSKDLVDPAFDTPGC